MKRSGLRSRLAALVTVCITCVCLLSLSSVTAWAKVGSIKEFPIPTFTSNSIAITAGPDGNLWFTEFHANKIGRITTNRGIITEFPVGSAPDGITAGPDGNLWFAENGANKIGRITTAGVVTEFPLPTNCGSSSFGCQPIAITAGPDGNLWFTENGANKIGRITTTGVVTGEFPIPTPTSAPGGITAGTDGNLWFTEFNANQIGRITTTGVVTEFPVPTPKRQLIGITAGPAHTASVWFTEFIANQIGEISTK